MVEYCRFFFGYNVAEKPLMEFLPWNKTGLVHFQEPRIKETLDTWKKLETENPHLADNWRWQQLVMRAYYDAYIQQRQAYEKRLETQAYEI